MPKTNRQLLIALFSAFCLLWLSAVNAVQASSKLPPHVQDTSFIEASHSKCPDSSASDAMSHHVKVEHQSCSSVCVMKMPFEPTHYALQLAPSSIAPIGQDNIDKAVSRIQTLFRPPIQLSLIDSPRA